MRDAPGQPSVVPVTPPAIAIIPARGGSKRIPRKNVRLFLGVPAIQRVIGMAAQSGIFSRIVVSTDDEQIAEVARAGGAETPFLRSPELSDDHASTSAVISDAVRRLVQVGQSSETAVCCVYATSVLLESDQFARSYAAFRQSGCDYLMAVQRYAQPLERALRVSTNGRVEPVGAEQFRRRTQDLPAAFHDAGQLYWGTAAAWMGGEGIFGGTVAAFELDRLSAVDIDDEADWRFAEMVARFRGQS